MTASPPTAPRLPGGFAFEAELGRGGFGHVLEVRRESDGGRFAMKLLAAEELQRVRRELEAVEKVRHPAVLRCFGSGLFEGGAWVLMELARGTLGELRGDPSRLDEAWAVACRAGEGLAALHEQGLVHRDVKPENIFLTGEGGKIGDLGLIRGGEFETLTKTGWILGTPGFLAPEQARGERVGPAADVFALAACLYDLLEGGPPAPGDTPQARVVAAAGGRLSPLDRGTRLLTPEARRLLESGLAMDPADRPRDVATWARALARMPPRPGDERTTRTRRVEAPLVPRTPIRAAGPSTMRRRRGRRLGGVLAVGLLGAGIAGWLASRPIPPPPPRVVVDTGPFDGAWLRGLEDETRAWLDELASAEDDEFHRRRDPVQWTRYLDGFSHVTEFKRWLADGGKPETLPRQVQERLRAVDEDFVRKGLPAPFHPFLYVTPERSPDPAPRPEPPAYPSGSWFPGPPRPASLGGWARVGLARLRKAVDDLAAFEHRVADVLEGADPPRDLALLDFHGTHAFRDLFSSGTDPRRKGVYDAMELNSLLPRGRSRVSQVLGPHARLLAEALYALARALEEEGEDAYVVVQATYLLGHLGTTWISYLGHLRIEDLLGRVPPGPAGHYLAAHCEEGLTNGRGGGKGPQRIAAAFSRLWDHLEKAFPASLERPVDQHLFFQVQAWRTGLTMRRDKDTPPARDLYLEKLEEIRSLAPGIRARLVFDTARAWLNFRTDAVAVEADWRNLLEDLQDALVHAPTRESREAITGLLQRIRVHHLREPVEGPR